MLFCVLQDIDGCRAVALPLGRIASYYYLNYRTVRCFSRSRNAECTLQDILTTLCSVPEYEELPVRSVTDSHTVTQLCGSHHEHSL